MERKLVSIQSIDALDPIVGADNIVQARVMGWNVVVKKGEFSVGDPCVFFEIDSVLPDGPTWSEFMRPRHFRVRTLKLRGVLSQGLALPVSIVEGDPPLREVDLRERLGVTKFEPVLPDAREIAGPFPARVPKTDEIRLQSALGVLDEMRGQEFYVSTKCDGTSATYVRTDDGLTAASRNWSLKRGSNHVWQLAERYQLADRIPSDFAVQGEICGPGIQKNRLGLDAVDLFVFNVYDLRLGAFLPF
jgi:RNA ligase (TIGR02306 family)